MALIEIDGVSKTYPLENNRELTAIDRIDLSIADGEFISIIGPSSCGIGVKLPATPYCDKKTRPPIEAAAPVYNVSNDKRSPRNFTVPGATQVPPHPTPD